MADIRTDPYAVLGVTPDAEPPLIRHAYRQLARLSHPDLVGGSGDRMADLNAAWSVLGNPRRRQAFDRARARATDSCDPLQRPSAPEPGPLARRVAVREHASGTVLDFGRYAGWPLRELARRDPDYLEWLSRIPMGRRFRAETETLLAGQPRRGPG
jgi:curved DNA-binding protein CbpA